MGSNRNLGFNQRVPIVCSEELTWSSNLVQRCNRNRWWGDGYIPTLNHFRGHSAQVANGVWRLLNMPLTVGGVEATHQQLMLAADATVSSWPARPGAGVDMPIAGSGSDFTFVASGFRGSCDKAIASPGGGLEKHYDATAAMCDPSPTNKVLLIELVGVFGDAGKVASSGKLFSRNDKDFTDTNHGWFIGAHSNSNIYWSIGDGSQSVYAQTFNGMNDGKLYHLLMAYRDNGDSTSQTYGAVNGTRNANGYYATRACGDITPATPASSPFRIYHVHYGHERLEYFATFAPECGSLDPAELDNIARDRAQALFGWYPISAKGTARANTMSRACAAYGSRWISGARKFFCLGPNAMRWSEPEEDVHGPLGELSADQLFSESDIDSWTKNDAGDSFDTTNQDSVFDGDKAVGIIADSTDGQHGVYLGATLTAAQYVFWAIVEKATSGQPWCALRNSTQTEGRYFNLTTGALGGVMGGAPDDSFAIDLGGGRWLFAIVCTGTAASNTHHIYPCEDDGDTTFAGDGATVQLWVHHAQVELGTYPTSPIRTSGGTATRLADSFQLVAGDNVGGEDHDRGTVVARYRVASGQTYYNFCTISDGGASADRVKCYLNSGALTIATRASGGNDGDDSTDSGLADAALHDARWTFRPNRVECISDGVQSGSPDETADMPDDRDELDIMQNTAGNQQINGILPILRFLAQPSIKG